MMPILLLLVVCNILKMTSASNDLIWSENELVFKPLFDISAFSELKMKFMQRIKDQENHNFQKEAVVISYYQEPNFINFVDNDTRITGAYGEIWTILSDYLNFTLLPLKPEIKLFGKALKNGSFDGLLGLIQRNESQIVPRVVTYIKNTELLDFTVPLWNTRYHLYIRPEWKHDKSWIFSLFSAHLWYSVIVFLVILSLAGYVGTKYSIVRSNEKTHYSFQDHMFYTFAIASSQGCVPPKFYNKSKLIYLCTSVFSWIILVAFSSLAIYHMMNKKFDLPFTNFQSLFENSEYSLLAFKGSMIHDDLKKKIARFVREPRNAGRILYTSSTSELYNEVCFSRKKLLAVFEAEDRHKAMGKFVCQLVPTLRSYFITSVASGVKRGYRYKRTFDIGIIKLIETGIINAVKDRWLNWKVGKANDLPFQSIDVNQVYLFFIILMSGYVISIFILLIEHFVYFTRKIVAVEPKGGHFGYTFGN